MSISVKPHHPLKELLAKCLLGIQVVPVKEQGRMVNYACNDAVKWHEDKVNIMKQWIKNMEKILIDSDSVCPQCDERLGNYTVPYHPGVHKKDCELGIMLAEMKDV